MAEITEISAKINPATLTSESIGDLFSGELADVDVERKQEIIGSLLSARLAQLN